MLNATECCHTIGCNCGGTVQIEMLNKIPIWIYPAIIIGVAIILCFLTIYWSRKTIPHEHKFIPIVYGLLNRIVDEKGNELPHPDWYAGGCVVRDARFICTICGKEKS